MLQAPHKQVFVKINAFVDAGVAQLVEVLSSFPSLQTTESCQGDEETLGAWVCFYYGRWWEGKWMDLAHFYYEFLAPRLLSRVGNRVHIILYNSDFDNRPHCSLEVSVGAMPRVLKALRQMRREFNDWVARKFEYSYDTLHT